MDENGITQTLEAVRHLQRVVRQLPANGRLPQHDDVEAAVAGLDLLLDRVQRDKARLERTEQDLQEALRRAQAYLLRYQELFDFAPDGYLLTDMHAVIQEANYAAATMLGARREFLADKPLLFFVASDDRQQFTEKVNDLGRRREGWLQWEMKLSPRNPARPEVLVTAGAYSQEGRLAGLRWVLHDVTRRKEAEESLRAEKALIDSLIEAAEAIILVLDQSGRIRRVNPYVSSLTGYRPEELEGRWIADLLHPEDWPSASGQCKRLAAGDRLARGVHRLRTREGSSRTVTWSARALPSGPEGEGLILVVGNDITDLQEAQRRALQSERLAAIGQMAAGLAHESRNALQRSQACLAMLDSRLQGQPEALDLLGRVQKAQADLHRLYEESREYAAPLRLDLRPCRLADLWRQAWDELARVRGNKKAQLCEEVAGDDLECLVSPLHLKQVFRNLLENALSAGGAAVAVTIRCQPATLEGAEAIRVAVQDDGPGFSEAEKQRAFEAFFTTKVRGTGLGLAISKRIVEAHRGRIAVGEVGGPGAAILITLPRWQRGDPQVES